MSSRWGLLAVCALLLAAGCLGTSPAEDGQAPPEDEPDQDEAPGGVTTLAESGADTPLLGLAAYDVPRENVENLVPANMTPTECFYPKPNGTVDVALLFEERAYEAMPFAEDRVRLVGLFGCAERPGGLAREEANEPPWVRLMDWGEAEGYADFRKRLGAPTLAANISMETIPRGFTVQAEAEGTTLVEARIVGSPVGIPTIDVESCEPIRQDGRSIFASSNGSLIALDWNKTEAICPAEADVSWTQESPLADVLGPARPPSFVVDVHVEESHWWWRSLPSPAAAG